MTEEVPGLAGDNELSCGLRDRVVHGPHFHNVMSNVGLENMDFGRQRDGRRGGWYNRMDMHSIGVLG